MKKLLFTTVLYSVSFLLIAQNPAPKRSFAMPNIAKVYGKILDSVSHKAVPYVSVAVYKMEKDSLLGGSLAKENGEFAVENLPFGKFRVKISFLGYNTKYINATLSMQNIEQDLGDISFFAKEKELKGVEIDAKRNPTQMGIDRKIFYTDKLIASKGGTATDVLKNVPSVTVDNDGSVLLRNSKTEIYVDGRPTALTADQIPADQIEKVEIITNPSAKFDASTTGGILNIVLKKNSKPGYNGMVMAGIGTGKRYNTMVSLNLKEKKINLGVSYNINSSANPNAEGYTNRTNLLNGAENNYYDQTNKLTFGNTMQFGRLGLDYSVNNRNTLTLAYTLVAGAFNVDDEQTFAIGNIIFGEKKKTLYGNRLNQTRNNFTNQTFQMLWKKTFPQQGRESSADINFNYNPMKPNSYFTTNNFDTAGNSFTQYQNNYGNNLTQMGTLQIDYIYPKNDHTKIETGVRSFYRNTSTHLDVFLDNDKKIFDPYTSSNYAIAEMVNAAYYNYQSRWKNIGYQAGLRFEQSHFMGDPRDTIKQKFSYDYPGKGKDLFKALFPALYLSKKLKSGAEFQVNYSRKINRPNFFQMMPFIMMSDKQNYRIGNPKLTPEFINLSEINFQKLWKKGNLLSSLYFKSIENPLTLYSTHAVTDPKVIVTTTINGKLQTYFGTDNNFKWTFAKKLDMSLNANIFYTKIETEILNQTFVNKGLNWNGKAIVIYKFPKDISLQWSGNYESPKVIAQGTSNKVYFMDLGLLKEFGKFASINFTLSDIMNTKRNGAYYETTDYIQYFSRRRETRYFKVTIMVRFGKVDASIFKRKPMKPQQGGGDEMF